MVRHVELCPTLLALLQVQVLGQPLEHLLHQALLVVASPPGLALPREPAGLLEHLLLRARLMAAGSLALVLLQVLARSRVDWPLVVVAPSVVVRDSCPARLACVGQPVFVCQPCGDARNLFVSLVAAQEIRTCRPLASLRMLPRTLGPSAT